MEGGGGDGRDGDCNGKIVKWGGYFSNHNLRDRSECSPCLCSRIETTLPDYE